MSLPTDDKSYTVYKLFRNKRSSSGANIFTNLEKEKKKKKKDRQKREEERGNEENGN